ncbi:MAG TPA: alkaline phosphatase family protein, partial [Polyangiales bacterium]|nr:alkaline phosphatase family protein [Polyangiales bacterium]
LATSADAAVAADSGAKILDASQTSLDSSTVDAAPAEAGMPATSAKLKHLVVIYMENHSFDNLYGSWEGAGGLATSAATATQTDPTASAPFSTLPQTDPLIPLTLANKPYDITQYLPANQATAGDPVHRWYQEQAQINGGKMDLFAGVSNVKGMVMGYYPTASLPVPTKLKSLGNKVTVLDHFFHAAFGGSFLNHIWLVAAASPLFPNAPTTVAGFVAVEDANGKMVTDGVVTPDGYVVNTAQTINTPHAASVEMHPEQKVPSQVIPTIGDRLIAKNIDFAWYSGGWDDALAGHPDAKFQYHHQPLAYFQTFADGTDAKAKHLKDESEFFTELAAGKLPPVSFVKPVGANNEHPQYADVITGENHLNSLIDAIMQSPTWSDTAVIITYDENGGFWDHVAPPKTDKWGPGSRVPAIVISNFAKGGVDKTVYDTTAILKLIDERWGTESLNARVAGQASLLEHAFDFSK